KSGAGVADTEGTSYRVTPSVGASIFEPGRTNYWYVEGRFADPSGDTITSPRGQHMVGLDSFVIGQFSLGLARAVLVSPFGGSLTLGEDVPLEPVLQWQAVEGADRYELQVDTSASFLNPFVNLTDTGRLDATVYRIEKELEYSTTYYWRVRAANPGSMGDWSMAGGFTTVARPVPPPVIQVTTTSAPTVNILEPGTPSWVRVVIVFGVLMVIVMLVLILRTRRA
ncbi:MAG: fibronectin type III domain-containing protein, partial [Dehalococcoidia bacterium]